MNGFQALIKDQYSRCTYGDKGKTIETATRQHMQRVFSILVQEPYQPLVLKATDIQNWELSAEILKHNVKEITNDLLDKILNYALVLRRGNSIYYSTLPQINPLMSLLPGIEISPPKIPTYYFARDLKNHIN